MEDEFTETLNKAFGRSVEGNVIITNPEMLKELLKIMNGYSENIDSELDQLKASLGQ